MIIEELSATVGIARASVGEGCFGDPVGGHGQTVAAGHVADDQGFQTFFSGISGGHRSSNNRVMSCGEGS